LAKNNFPDNIFANNSYANNNFANNKLLNGFIKIILFTFLTIVTQIGGLLYVLSEIIFKSFGIDNKVYRTAGFIGLYALFTFIVVPFIASKFGREPIHHSTKVTPTTFMTVVLNRNYVSPKMNRLLKNVSENLNGTEVNINYLDANFPFFDKFPLLPHLSHNDGKKLDISLIYETSSGEISTKQKSNSGYGVFEGPMENEFDQIDKCYKNGFFQYSYPKYLTLGTKNTDLKFSENGTLELIQAILKTQDLGALFIEPHLKERLKLSDGRIKYHGCKAVRHDDHIHLQLK
jgi:hypothetical protein